MKTEYRYFLLRNCWVARLEKGSYDLETKEFYINGTWQYDDELNLKLNDSMMDYGDYSVFDYDEITEEEALKRIENERNISTTDVTPSTAYNNKSEHKASTSNETHSPLYNYKSEHNVSNLPAVNINHELACERLEPCLKSLDVLREKYQDDSDALDAIDREEDTLKYHCKRGEYEKMDSSVAQLEACLHDWY